MMTAIEQTVAASKITLYIVSETSLMLESQQNKSRDDDTWPACCHHPIKIMTVL